MWKRFLVLSLAFWLTGSLTGAVSAQSTTGSISGVVKDNNGAVIPDARVNLANPATGIAQSAMTNSDGVFLAPQLPAGVYTITIEHPGFKKFTMTGVSLSAADRLNAGALTLETGAVTDTVTVTADAGQLQVQSESGERSSVITNEQVRDLALNGRDLLDLMKILPGVISDFDGQISGPGGLDSFNINGTRGNQKELTIDGSSAVDTGSNGTRHVTVNPDAVSEVKILTSNYQAEFGKAGGGFIQFVTLGGSKRYQGGARFFHRHEGLNANNFFNNARGLGRPLYRYNNIGWDFGGPVRLPWLKFNQKKDKLFFFVNQEYYEQLRPGSARLIRVPTEAERRGDFSQTVDGNGNKVYIKDPLKSGACGSANQTACFPGNIIPADRFYASGQAILNIYPLANVTGNPQYNYVSQASADYPRRETTVRVDYNVTAKTRVSARYTKNGDEQRLPYGVGWTTNHNFPFGTTIFLQPGINSTLNIASTLSPTLLNEFIFGPSTNELTQRPAGNEWSRQALKINVPLLFPNANPDDIIPNFTYSGISNQTFPSTGFGGVNFHNINHTFNFTDNLTKLLGRHTTKTGIFAQRSRKDQTAGGPNNATINFSNNSTNTLNAQHPFAAALLGIYNSYTQSSTFLTGAYRYWNIEGYMQDSWRIHRRLGLDFGLRVSWYEPQYDERLQTAVFRPDLYDPEKAVRLFEPILVNGATRAVDPANRPATPTTANTLANSFIGLIVPGSGDILNGMALNGHNGNPRGGYDNRGMQWGPRFGFAWDISGRGKTVLRGGFGISYDRVQGNLAFNQITNPPAALTPILSFGRLEDIANVRDGYLSPLTVIGYSKDGKIPNIYSFSLNFQHDLGFKTVVDIAYVGTQGRHLSQQRNLNAIPYYLTFSKEAQDATRFTNGIVPDVEPNLPAVYTQAGFKYSGNLAKRVEFLRPYIGFNDINYREFSASSNYNSLQISLNRRFANNLSFGVAYTWSKAFTTASNDTQAINPFDTRAYEYRLADFDRTHVLAVNYIYRAPNLRKQLGDHWLTRYVTGGWELSGITRASSGTPYELGSGTAGIGLAQRVTGSYTDGPRFYLNGDPQIGSSAGTNGVHINTSALVISPVGNIGPWPRNYLRRPGYLNFDISLFKNVQIGKDSRRSLQFRLEAFNALNHTQFSGVNNGVNLAVQTGVDSSGNPVYATGGAIFTNYDKVIISNNIRGQRASDVTRPLGQFFGESNSARDPRIIQLGVKLYF